MPSAVDEEKIIVFSSCLLTLFKTSPSCGSNRVKAHISYRCRTCIVIEQFCQAYHHSRKWSNQPKVGDARVAVGNLILAGSIFACGLPCKETLRMMKQLNIASISFSAGHKTNLASTWCPVETTL